MSKNDVTPQPIVQFQTAALCRVVVGSLMYHACEPSQRGAPRYQEPSHRTASETEHPQPFQPEGVVSRIVVYPWVVGPLLVMGAVTV